MNPPDTLDFWALEVFACYNEYGLGESDVTEAEAEQWDEFVSSLPSDKRRPPSHITTTDETDSYRKCEVTGLMGTCVKFTAVWL